MPELMRIGHNEMATIKEKSKRSVNTYETKANAEANIVVAKKELSDEQTPKRQDTHAETEFAE